MVERKLNTRQDFADLMLTILKPLKPYYSTGKARLNIGCTSAHYPDESAWMEGFSRPLWGLAAFWAGGGSDDAFEKIYREGLVSGTDPASSEYWEKCGDYDQKLVEMAAIAFAILFAREKIMGAVDRKREKSR